MVFKPKKYTLHIELDDYGTDLDPLENDDGTPSFLSLHRHYYPKHINIESHRPNNSISLDELEELREPKESMFQTIEKYFTEHEFQFIKIYMYSHSGDTISTSPFNDRWDSGVFGYLYWEDKDIQQWHGVSEVTQELRDKEMQTTLKWVEYWDAYIRGEIYYTIIKDENAEEIHSCYGYIGYDNAKECGEMDLKHYQDEIDKKYNLLGEMLEMDGCLHG